MRCTPLAAEKFHIADIPQAGILANSTWIGVGRNGGNLQLPLSAYKQGKEM
jgi:hypothetical protein